MFFFSLLPLLLSFRQYIHHVAMVSITRPDFEIQNRRFLANRIEDLFIIIIIAFFFFLSRYSQMFEDVPG